MEKDIENRLSDLEKQVQVLAAEVRVLTEYLSRPEVRYSKRNWARTVEDAVARAKEIYASKIYTQ